MALEWVRWPVWGRKLSQLRVCINHGSHGCKNQTLNRFGTGSCQRKIYFEHPGCLGGHRSGWEPGIGLTRTPSFTRPVHALVSLVIAALPPTLAAFSLPIKKISGCQQLSRLRVLLPRDPQPGA